MFCGRCGSNVPDGAANCPNCGNSIAPKSAPNPAPTYAQTPVSSAQGMNFDFNSNTASPVAAAGEFYEYKVLSQKDKWLSGKFDPMILEQALNAYAAQGWRVIGCATADIPGFGTTRQEFITLLERKR